MYTVNDVVKLYSDKVNDYNRLVDDYNDQVGQIEVLTVERDALKEKLAKLEREYAALELGAMAMTEALR